MLTDHELLHVAYLAAQHSQDTSTQNGAVLVSSDGRILFAYNDIPNSVVDTPERRERPAKYAYTEHAERAVIYKAVRWGLCTTDATLYCPWFACADCARAIICAGITRCVGHKTPLHDSPRWQDSIAIAMGMLKEADIRCDWIEGDFGLEILFDGKKVRV